MSFKSQTGIKERTCSRAFCKQLNIMCSSLFQHLWCHKQTDSTWIEICDVTGKSKSRAKPFIKAFTKIEVLK